MYLVTIGISELPAPDLYVRDQAGLKHVDVVVILDRVVGYPVTLAKVRQTLAGVKGTNEVAALLFHQEGQHQRLVALAAVVLTQYTGHSPILIEVDGGWDRKTQRYKHTVSEMDYLEERK